ncbi:nucleoside hydrolase [Spongiactinospora rosea]|uniref:Nucleoside hydrolase n=1 Tax=Spongiactinospora rosea TaxID=2248750 RepID=A0A366LNV5_9ACTN|nr:nucleoside hydrolase [Spongiactinospora rosea]RBQ15079.1 nucleoside hydrolase [Spongiactinospora rosea]
MSDVRTVIHDHDGGLDDILSLLLLTRYGNVALRGVTVTPADCLLAPALSVTRKVLAMTGLPHVPVAAGELQGRNPFPLEWRIDALRMDALPVLNRPGPLGGEPVDLPAHRQLAAWLLAAEAPVTVLATGPMTNLAWCLDRHPEVEPKIAEVVFMGGALDVPGNVDQPGHDGSAEWNIYWDPDAAQRVFDSGVPVTMFPLDITDLVPIIGEFACAFGEHYGNPVSDLAGTLLAMTFGTLETTGMPYCGWDSLTTSYLAVPDMFEFETARCRVVTTGPSQGRTVRDPAGRPVKCARTVDPDHFYKHCLATLT